MRVLFSDIDLLRGGVPRCSACGLCGRARSPRMELCGDFHLGILNVGEAPGELEDARGLPWQGRAGERLRCAYEKIGVDLFGDCLNINACSCRPIGSDGDNRTPTDTEIACCRPRVLSVIAQRRPKVVVLLGNSAVSSVIGYRWTKDLGTISRWRGWAIPDRALGCWLLCAFHPSYVDRGGGRLELETVWRLDLEIAVRLAATPLPVFEDESRLIEIVDDLLMLDVLGDPIAFDFETTGLKPHDTSKHKIVCMSASDGVRTFSFLMPDDAGQLAYVRKLLKSKRGKIASNMKYEDTWSEFVLGYRPANWLWDTMLASHVLDNRSSVSGLKFQAYVQFGLAGYGDDVASFLKSHDERDGNAVNSVGEMLKTAARRRRLLTYCGMDSLLEFRLAELQMQQIRSAA